MIEVHADDYGMFPESSRLIIDCINNGCVNGTSIMPNSSHFEECMRIYREECHKEAFLSVHFDLITGKALTGRSVITDDEGYFNLGYFKYIIISLIPFYRDSYIRAIKKELSAQLDACLPYLDRNALRIDSHRHIHMVPLIFRLIMELLNEKKLKLSYIRITKDAPFVFRGLLSYEYFRPVNIIKSLLMILFGTFNEIRYSGKLGKRAAFASILFSGSMTEKNLKHVLRNIREAGTYKNNNIEIMVHPYVVREEKNIEEIHDTEDRSYVVSPLRHKEYAGVKNPEIIKMIDSIDNM